jgi:hypothetical protein
MARRHGRRVGAVVAALALLTAACGDDDDDTGAGTDTTEMGGEEVEALSVSAVDYAFEGLPDEIPGGIVELSFTNDGEADHEIAFVEIGDVDADQFFEDFAPYIEGSGPAPDYATNIVGANEAEPGGSTDLVYTLEEGRYVAFCALTDVAEGDGAGGAAGEQGTGGEGSTSTSAGTSTSDDQEPIEGGAEGDAEEETTEGEESEEGPPHFTLGMQQIVDVTAAEGDGELPAADGTISAVDYDFEVDLEAGDTTINFTNEGPDQPHFAGFDRYDEGTTTEEALEAFGTFFTLEEGEEPPEDMLEAEEVGFSGVATPGNSIQFELREELEPGTYVFYCFIADREGGPPHALPPEQGGHGMVRAFAIE